MQEEALMELNILEEVQTALRPQGKALTAEKNQGKVQIGPKS